jgi:hypothetical protein
VVHSSFGFEDSDFLPNFFLKDNRYIGIFFGVQANTLQLEDVLLSFSEACSPNSPFFSGNLAWIDHLHSVGVGDDAKILQKSIG